MTTNLQLARQVARQVQIENVVLRKAEVEASFEPSHLPPELSLIHGFRSQYDVESLAGGRTLNVTVDFKFEAREAGEDGPGDIKADLSATFLLQYSLPSDFEASAECLEQFAAVNGVYNAWPYWRELVQTSTGRIGLPGVILPVYRPSSQEIAQNGCDKND